MRRPSLAIETHLLVEERVALSARPEELAALHETLARFWAAVDRSLPGPPDEIYRMQLETAIFEITTNIMRHAYGPEVTTRPLACRLRSYDTHIEARLADAGIAFTAMDAPERMAAFDMLTIHEGGYGLMVTRAAIDNLSYRRTRQGINSWRLLKWFAE